MRLSQPSKTEAPVRRVLAAFLVAPAVAAMLMAIMMPAFNGIGDPLERFWRSALVFALIGAYPPAILLGLPAFFILRRRASTTLLNCVVAGAVVASIPWLLLSLFSRPDNASVDGQPTVINGAMTQLGWLTNLQAIGSVAAFGAFGGAIFWLIVTRGARSEHVNAS